MRTTGSLQKVLMLFALFFLFSIQSAFSHNDTINILNPGVSGVWHPDTLYRVHVNILVAEEDTLTILPGTTVEFLGNTRFEVAGVLIAEGEAGNSIQFTKVSTSEEKWNGLRLMNAKRSNYFSKIGYCDFSYVNANDGAALSVNSGVSDIKNCSFYNIDSNGIVVQSGSPVESILFFDNSFSSIDGYPINIYQNYSLSQIDVKDNKFIDCYAGLFVSITQVSSINIENNTISDSQLGVSFISIAGNPVLANVLFSGNIISNISGADVTPYLIDIGNNEALELVTITNNNVQNSLRIASVNGAGHSHLKDNTIMNSENLVFEHLYHLECDDITVDHEVIHDVDLKELGASYISLYSMMPENDVIIENCDIENIIANCFYLHPENSFGTLSIVNNTVTNCNSEYNDGGILRLESDQVYTINSIEFFDNSFTDVTSKDFGGTAFIELPDCEIGNLESSGNTFVSETEDAGGVFRINCKSITVCDFSDDTVDGTITDSDPEIGTGGFMSLTLIDAPDTISIADYVVEKAYAVSHGGFMSVEITGDQKDLSFLGIENVIYKDVVSENGNGGFFGLSTPAGIVQVEISEVETSGDYTRTAISGGFLYLNTQSGPEILSITNCDFTNVATSGAGGHVAILSEGDISELSVEGSSFSSDPSAGFSPEAGGAFYVTAQNVADAYFYGNTFTDIHATGNGGMIMISANDAFSSQAFHDNSFTNGSADENGGAIFLSANNDLPSKLLFTDNDFSNTNSDSNGGAIYYNLANGALLHGVLFENNTFNQCVSETDGMGGAISLTSASVLDTVFVKKSDFSNCTAPGSGGAMYLSAASIENFIIDGNGETGFDNCQSLEGDGGSIFLNSTSQGVKNIQLLNFDANGGSSLNASGNGGLIAISSAGNLLEPLYIRDLNLSGLSSDGSGGAINLNFYNNDIEKDVEISNCSFSLCEANGEAANGGALNVVSGKILSDIIISDNTSANCSAGLNGGAMHLETGETRSIYVMENNVFSGCKAANGNGGALSFEINGVVDGDINILDNEFSGGTMTNAGGIGGAVSLHSLTSITGELNVERSQFVDLKSIGNGGALALDADAGAAISKININGNNVEDCIAEGENSDGGAMYLYAGSIGDTIIINKNVVAGTEANANGGGFCINVADAKHLRVIGAPGVTTFSNCKALNHSGGAVYCKIRNGGLDKLAIENNTIQGSNEVAAGEHGGAIFIDLAGDIPEPVLIKANAISGLKASGNGGAIAFDVQNINGGVLVSDNLFSDLSAGISGGALFIDAANITEISVMPQESVMSFDNCVAEDSNGGAVCLQMTGGIDMITLNATAYSNCAAGANGGAIAVTSNNSLDQKLQISANTFDDCSANGAGGSLSFDFNDGQISNGVIIGDNAFTASQATGENGNGGAIAILAGTIINSFEVLDNNFEDCTSEYNGGAISLNIASVDTLLVKGQGGEKDFRNCIAENGNGGAMNLVMTQGEMDLLEVSDNIFDGCEAGVDGGTINVFAEADIINVEIVNNTFTNGTAGLNGGAISTSIEGDHIVNDIQISNNEFSYLEAGTNGGAINITGNNIDNIDVLINSFTSSYTVNGNGGALYITDGVKTLSLEEDSFTACSAGAGDGGAVYITALPSINSVVGFNNLTFSNSGSQTMNGGAAFMSGAADVSIENCNFTVLEASSRGGAIFLNDIANITLSNNNYSQCSTNESAGAIWAENNNSGMIAVSDSHFEFNSAKYFGGAIYVKGFSDFNLSGCEMLQNTISATGSEAFGGGAVYAEDVLLSDMNENYLYDNHADNDNKVVPTYGGGVYFNACEELMITGNDMRLNEAVSGGAVFINEDFKTIINSNIFSLNEAIHGGAVGTKSSMASMDSLLIRDNDFLDNMAGYRGGAVYSDRDRSFLVRNKFIRNTGATDDLDIKVKGSSVYFSRDVSNAAIYNSVFDRNEDLDVDHSDNATVYLDASTGSSYNSERLIVENCSFLNNWPYAAHAIYNTDVMDTVTVINSVFQGNVLQNDSLFNNASIISDFSRLEGDQFEVAHTNPLPAYYPYLLEEETYMLSNTSQYIDLGNPAETYNDNFMPPGLGEGINDPGHTGGRYNTFCEDCLDRPEAWTYNDSLVVVRTDCDTYHVSFYHSMASSFDHFQWFIDGQTFVTDENLLEFTYPAEKNILLLALATSATYDDVTMAGRAWIYNREIVHDGLVISYTPDGTLASEKADDVTFEVTYGDDCLEDITLYAKLKDLVIPDMGSYNYVWSFEAGEGIIDTQVDVIDEDDALITISIDKDFAGSDDLHLTLGYSGEDGCGLQCSDEIIIHFTTTGFNALELFEATPENGDNVAYDQFFVVELTMNQVCGYLDNGNYTNIPLNQDINDLQLVEFTDGVSALEINSIKAVISDDMMHFLIYPDTTQLVFEETYSVILSDNVVTECGWSVEPYDYEFTIVEVGINDYNLSVSVRPNPVQELLFVNPGNSVQGELRIYNVAGVQVKMITTSDPGEIRLDVSDLSKGVYMLEYRSEGSRVMKKIIKE